jgi:hypothetical protein
MRRGIVGAVAAAGMLMLVGPAAAMANAGDVILGGSQSSVDYHAEAAPAKPADGGATIIGGNIQIVSDRGTDDGQAGACDPDPRFGDHPRPDDEGCEWDEPVGSGEDFISFGRHIGQQDFAPDTSGDTGSGDGGSGDVSGDTDASPDGAYAPMTTATRESFNGRGGLDDAGNLFLEDRPVLDDEDLNLRIVGAGISNYLAPQGNPNNRWRRLCGTGKVEKLDYDAELYGPFKEGDTVPFVVQVWDADWQNPSDMDGGNQDYFIIDVFPAYTKFDVATCRAMKPDKPLPPPPATPPAMKPTPTPPAVAPNPQPAAAKPAAAAAVKGVKVVRGRARLAGARTCPIRPFNVRVTGRQIRRVTFFVDGRRLGSVTRRIGGQYRASVDPRRLRAGVHRVRARVEFVRGAGPARTMNMSFRVCARPAQRVQPQFTG